MRFFCEDVDNQGNPIPGTGCGEIDHIVFDGYSFGDRELEGVMMEARIVDNAIVVDAVGGWDTGQDRNYLKRLNKDYYLEEGRLFALQNDVATCPHCGNDIDAQPRP